LFNGNLHLVDSPSFQFYQLCKIIEGQSNEKKLFLLVVDNSFEFVYIYTQLMRCGHSCILLDSRNGEDEISNVIRSFCPFGIVSKINNYDGYRMANENYGITFHICRKDLNYTINDDLALLLSTSGTTSSKFVALSYSNLISNAESISQYLEITDKDIGITNLPISYSYGLSVVNSHWIAGASLLCTNHSVVNRVFWDEFVYHGCTSLSGVPKTYDLLDYIGFESMTLPSLRFMTQAGGRMRPDMIKKYHKLSVEKEFELFIMYGQTEATARISYVPPKCLADRIGSVGIAIPKGGIFIKSDSFAWKKQGDSITKILYGSVMYKGDNIMMGYVESYKDLDVFDKISVLDTGDRGCIDDGYLYLKGREGRTITLFGLELNLSSLESKISDMFCVDIAVIYNGDVIIIITEDNDLIDNINEYIWDQYSTLFSTIQVESLSFIPRTLHGKIDYNKIGEMCPR
jgi:long-subunit acyl-CoA synthetase (AMP-forming)